SIQSSLHAQVVIGSSTKKTFMLKMSSNRNPTMQSGTWPYAQIQLPTQRRCFAGRLGKCTIQISANLPTGTFGSGLENMASSITSPNYSSPIEFGTAVVLS